MPGDADEPLPDEIALTRTEAASVLFALDATMEALRASAPVRGQLREAARILVEKFLRRSAEPVRRRRIMSMGEHLRRVPEVARLLRIDGTDVYALIDKGELKAGKGEDGLVYVSDDALSQYREKHQPASR